MAFTICNVNSRGDNVDAINKSPDYIQTDKLKGLLRLLKYGTKKYRPVVC